MKTHQFSALMMMMRAHWFAVSVCVLLGALGGAALSALTTPTYNATAVLFMATPSWNDVTASWQPDDQGRVQTYAFGDEFTQHRVLSYQQLANSERVASAVIDQLGLTATPTELARQISARVVPDTVIMEVRAQDSSPRQAARLADAAAEALSDLVRALETPSSRNASPVQPVVLERAEVPAGPTSPRPVSNIIGGSVLGLLVGITYASIRERLRAERLTPCEDSLGVLAVGDLPKFATLDDVNSGLAESARFLRMRVAAEMEAIAADGGRSMLITSPRATHAVGTTAVLLAAAFSEFGERVVIVMTNFESPGTQTGLGEVLDGKSPLSEALRYADGVGTVAAGSSDSTPIAALGGERMREVLRHLADDFDRVIVVGAPVLESAESLQLARAVDAAMLVCPVPAATAAEEITQGERLLSLSPAQVLGRVTVIDGAAKLPMAGSGSPNGDRWT
jgi:succinoglycan biosynthesis transport protein ExoP